MSAEDRWKRPRIGFAVVLALSLLGLTYTLFDPDLGTDVPLFQEFTCHARLQVTATDPGGQSTLRPPQMALKMTATADGQLRPARFTVFTRTNHQTDWDEYFAVSIPAGEHLMYLAPVVNETQVYIVAKELEGRYCAGRSGVVGVSQNATSDLRQENAEN